MSGIESVYKGAGFRSSHLADNNAVWTVTEDGFEEIVESYPALVGIQLSLG
jgi:hypothetical protein